ncbi:hypothetical protein [Clostridium frigidicarnis]|uniref:Uncharacterized protein n=1 Tax=Clostridium frigidicarnis TaxID=84698 RepID=A0A1I1AYN7_9CLOT|nr:hypothetical protein [Clostridium frigidicarnis]SFB43184.1 hypothetical protein SAMN04488528_10549 [Clostridium frigidicarnis]
MNLKDCNFKFLYRKWKDNSGPFECFIRSGPFVSLQTYDNFHINTCINKDLYKKHKSTISKILDIDLTSTFLILDIPLDIGLEIGYVLNNMFKIKPILNLNFLFHPYGLVGNKTSIESLIKCGLNLDSICPSAYVLLLDYNRYDDFPKNLYKVRLNNQYELTLDDLPHSSTLKELNYSKVVIFTMNKIKEDISYYLNTINKDLNTFILEVI